MAVEKIPGIEGPVSIVRVVDESGASPQATIGAVDDAAETDPSEEATVISLLKGILSVLKDIETNTAS